MKETIIGSIQYVVAFFCGCLGFAQLKCGFWFIATWSVTGSIVFYHVYRIFIIDVRFSSRGS